MPTRTVLILALSLLSACARDPKVARDKYFASAEQYFKDGKFDEAAIQYRNALQKDNGHIPSYLGLARTAHQLGDYQNAIGLYRQVLKLDGSNIEARLRLGDYMVAAAIRNSEVFKQAQQMAEEVLKMDDKNVEARVLLASAYSGQREFDKALAELEEAIALDPANLNALLNLGAVQLNKNDPVKAEAAFREALQRHPDSAQAYLSAAAFYGTINKMAEAEASLKKAFDLAPDNPNCLGLLSGFYLSTKKPAEAENVFIEAIKRKPQAREPRWGLADFYLGQRNTEKGMNALLELQKIKPADNQVRRRIAELYFDQKNDAKAEEQVRAVLASNKNDADAHYLLGKILRRRQENDKALIEFDAAIAANGSLLPAYLEKANILLIRGDLDTCQTTLESALQLNRNYMPARGALAKLLAMRQRPQEALQQSQEVLAAMPNNEDAIWARAEALRMTGKLDDAKKDYLRLSEIDPRNPNYWHRLGTVELQQGDSRTALAHMSKAVDLRPDYVPALNDIVYVYVREKQFDAAIAELDRVEKMPGARNDEIHRIRGQLSIARGDQAAAESEFRKCIELNPKNYQAYFMLGQLKMQQNKIPEALKEVDQLIARNDKLAPAYTLKAYYLQASKDVQGAIANYRKALELDPENPVISNNLAWLLCENNINLDEALSLARTARKKLPGDSELAPEVADTLGWIYYHTKNYTLAVDQLVFSVNNRRQSSAASYYHLGVAAQAKGDGMLARQSLRKALELNPSHAEARKALDSLEPSR
jgi:tetratricopeptide (TPR) repeat protein